MNPFLFDSTVDFSVWGHRSWCLCDFIEMNASSNSMQVLHSLLPKQKAIGSGNTTRNAISTEPWTRDIPAPGLLRIIFKLKRALWRAFCSECEGSKHPTSVVSWSRSPCAPSWLRRSPFLLVSPHNSQEREQVCPLHRSSFMCRHSPDLRMRSTCLVSYSENEVIWISCYILSFWIELLDTRSWYGPVLKRRWSQ